MTTYTQADADAAKAKLATDQDAIAKAQQAISTDQLAVTQANDEIAAAQQGLAAAQAIVAADQAALEAATADAAVQQAIIDAFAAQPPPPPPVTGTLPDMPALPVGPFTKHSAFIVASPTAINLKGVEFGGSYICINHNNKAISLAGLNLDNITCDAEAGSLFYCGSLCGGKGASIGTVACMKGRPGRPFLRFCGVWGPIEIQNLTFISDPTPNHMTGDIGTGIQVGNKAAGEALESVIIRRAHVENIFCSANPTDPTKGWQPGDYWNGDGLTTERTLNYFQVDNFYGKNITDGGIDSKARKNVFGKVYVENMRAALKLWDDTDCAHLTSVNPKVQGGIGGCSHLRLMGGTRVRVFNFPDVNAKNVDTDAPLFRVENGPVKITASGTFNGSNLLFATNGGSVTADSTWNGKPIK